MSCSKSLLLYKRKNQQKEKKHGRKKKRNNEMKGSGKKLGEKETKTK